MPDTALLEFHLQSFELYLGCWDRPEDRQAAGVSAEEAAYHLLEHAGRIGRHAGSSHCADALRGLPRPSRKDLVLAACRYVDGIRLADRCRRLLVAERSDLDPFEELEAAVLRCDALRLVLDLAGRLSDDLLGNPDVAAALGRATARGEEITGLLSRRPDLLAAAGVILADEPGGLPGWLSRATQPSRPRVLRFRRMQPAAKREPALAAAGGEEVIHLASEEGARLRAFPSTQAGEYTLHWVDPVVPASSGTPLLAVGGRPVPWVRPPDEEGYALVSEEDIAAVLRGKADLEIALPSEAPGAAESGRGVP